MTPKFVSILFICATVLLTTPSKWYTRQYNASGQLLAEGWLDQDKRTDFWKWYHNNGRLASEGHYKNDHKSGYWHFYDLNGNLIKEGHYQNGRAYNWWIFYDLVRQEKRKVQFQNNQKNGFCLVYKENKLLQVEKFVANKKTGSWTNLRDFKRDNPETTF
ncbi:MAG: hypothetical protein CL867_12735 [Cytophagaceae bacterium]|nr:hypothetical protein [Cytophagaceae bacterium]